MSEEAKWAFISALDDELLKGGAILSEWCAFIVRDCDYAFVGGANLAPIITATAAIETYLRAEYAGGKRIGLANLIDSAPIETGLRNDIHKFRKYRNTWVHAATPEDDEAILQNPEAYEERLEEWAELAQRTLRRTICESQWTKEARQRDGYPGSIAIDRRAFNPSPRPKQGTRVQPVALIPQ